MIVMVGDGSPWWRIPGVVLTVLGGGGVLGGYDGWVSSLGSILGFIIERGRSHGGPSW